MRHTCLGYANFFPKPLKCTGFASNVSEEFYLNTKTFHQTFSENNTINEEKTESYI